MLNRDLFYSIINKFGVEVDAEAFERLDKYAEMLVETNKSFNLTAITELDEVTVKHFADCVSVLWKLDIPKNAKVIDVGTGAGFPGLVLLLIRPDIDMTFIDSTKKKLGFIQNVLDQTGIKATVVHARAEEAGKSPQFREKYDFATARAVSNLTNLSEYCLPFVKKGGSFISMKAVSSDEEIENAAKAIKVLGGKIEHDYIFDLTENMPRRIIEIKKISQTPTKYPRPSAKIAKNPIK